MPRPDRGEVWLVDLGYAAKVRPCLVLSVPPEPQDRVLITLVPHTTSVQGTRFEVAVPKRFLQPGAFDAQGLVTVATARLIRKLGKLQPDELVLVEQAVKGWLGLQWYREVRGFSASLLVGKLTKDRTPVRNMIAVGLIDASWLTKLPPALAQRLKEILDTPDAC